jgi:hypothetical protein
MKRILLASVASVFVIGSALVSMAETKCAKGRRESVPVGLREKGCEARFIFVLPCRFIFRWRGLLRFAFSGFGFAPEPIAAVPSCWWRADSFRRSARLDARDAARSQTADIEGTVRRCRYALWIGAVSGHFDGIEGVCGICWEGDGQDTCQQDRESDRRLRHGQGTARRMRAAMVIARRQFSHYEKSPPGDSNPLWYEAEIDGRGKYTSSHGSSR